MRESILHLNEKSLSRVYRQDGEGADAALTWSAYLRASGSIKTWGQTTFLTGPFRALGFKVTSPLCSNLKKREISAEVAAHISVARRRNFQGGVCAQDGRRQSSGTGGQAMKFDRSSLKKGASGRFLSLAERFSRDDSCGTVIAL